MARMLSAARLRLSHCASIGACASTRWIAVPAFCLICAGLCVLPGCASSRQVARTGAAQTTPEATPESSIASERRPTSGPPVVLASNEETPFENDETADRGTDELDPARYAAASYDTLAELEALAQVQNPSLRRLQQDVAAARAKANYADKLPDPTVGANVFGHPIETAAGSQRSNLTVMQMIPWLERLDAQTQQACFEALAAEQMYETERLKVIGDVRALWYRLYVLARQIETNRGNQKLLQSLIDVANARIATGRASQGDVLLGTLELSKLAEQLLMFEQQMVAAKAELNRLAGRSPESEIHPPGELAVSLPDWTEAQLRQTALERQPAISAARLQTQAARWGLEVARLKRRPDVSVSATWFAIDDNRPMSSVVDVGRDAWSIGAQVSLPIWQRKYDAIEDEALQKNFAAHASVDDTVQRVEALLRDLWQQARTADETAKLYSRTIVPQARQTLETDLQSYTNGTVEFDRVVRDFQSVLTLELGYHRALGELAMVLARVQQAVGSDLEMLPSGPPLPPQPLPPANPTR